MSRRPKLCHHINLKHETSLSGGRDTLDPFGLRLDCRLCVRMASWLAEVYAAGRYRAPAPEPEAPKPKKLRPPRRVNRDRAEEPPGEDDA